MQAPAAEQEVEYEDERAKSLQDMGADLVLVGFCLPCSILIKHPEL